MEMLSINQRQIPFQLRKSKRAKRMILKVDANELKIILVVPRFTLNFQIKRFLREQEAWIESRWAKIEGMLQKRPTLDRSPAYYKAQAKKLIRERLAYYNLYYNFDYNRVFFRNQKTRWGSCSSNRNLSFNWRLVLAPLEILDYVVVHELCHLQEMNHSQDFWALVEKQIPDHKKRRLWLKENHCLLSV